MNTQTHVQSFGDSSSCSRVRTRTGRLAALGALAAMALSASAGAQVVISQVFGGGGSGTAGVPWKNDFVELFNQGSTPVSLTGLSIQYGSSSGLVGPTGGTGIVTLSGTVAPRSYFLVQVGTAGTAGSDLPTPDFSSTAAAMSATAGKVALVNGTAPLNVSNPVGDPAVLDFVGYGTANASETTPVGALSNTTAALRRLSGCLDSGNNVNDFVIGPSKPRNSGAGVNRCGGGLSEVRTDVVGTTPSLNGTLGAGEYGPGNAYVFRGDGTDFSGMIGWSPTAQRGVYFASDATGLNIGLNFGTDISADNTAVILLNTRTGGVPSGATIPFNNGDATQRAIARVLQCTMPNSAPVFPANERFEADYAIGVNRFGVFTFGVSTSGMIFVNSATTFGTGTSFATVREVRIPYTALVDFTPGNAVDFIVALNNGAASPNTFLSNESIPASAVLNALASPGNSGGTFSNWNRFVTFNPCTAPSITGEPSGSVVCAGQPASFTVSATGTGLSYQWRKDLTPINVATNASAGTPTLSLSSVIAGDAGSYDCVVTGTCGTATSVGATLTVNVAPSISTQPVAQTTCTYDAATFTVAATGVDPIEYQWQWRPEGTVTWLNVVSGVNINPGTGQGEFEAAGATGVSVTMTNSVGTSTAVSGGRREIQVVVTNPCGNQTSNVVLHTITTCRCNPADIAFDDGSPLPPVGTPGSDNNGVTEGDYNLFFATYFEAGPACDIANDDGTPLPPFGILDTNNGVTEGDYNLFFSIYFDGCAF